MKQIFQLLINALANFIKIGIILFFYTLNILSQENIDNPIKNDFVSIEDIIVDISVKDSSELMYIKKLISAKNFNLGSNTTKLKYLDYRLLRDSINNIEMQILNTNDFTPLNYISKENHNNIEMIVGSWYTAGTKQGNNEDWKDGDWKEGNYPSDYNGPGSITYNTWGGVGLDNWNTWGMLFGL